MSATEATLSGDWPTYGKGPSHTGYVPGKLNGLPWVQKWKTPMPHSVLSQVAVGGGRVYVSAGYYFSAMSLRALDANTGAGIWTNNLPSVNSISPPSYDSGIVFNQQGQGGTPSYIRSFDASTGATNWATPFTSQGYNYMAPVVAAGRVFTDTGYYHGLTSFNQTNGGQQWFVELGGSEQWAPAYYNGKVYTWLGSFTEWNPTTGTANWTLTNGLSGAASSRTVAIADERAYFIGSGLYCINLATHTNAWTINGNFSGTPAIANGIVYAISNHYVSAFTTNGTFVRQFDPNSFYENYSGPLIVTDDVLIAAGAYGIYVYRLADGGIQQLISSYNPANGFYEGMTISLANNTLYASSTDKNVYAFAATPTTTLKLINPVKLGNGLFQFSFTNTPGATFTVLTSTNATLPLSSWTSLGFVTQFAPGQYRFIHTNGTVNSQRFYCVSSP
jgi:large repetitive protein